MGTRRNRALLAAVLGVLCLLGQGPCWPSRAVTSASGRMRALPPGQALAWIALGGMRAVALGASWVRLLDAYRSGAYEEVPALAAVITTLDPQLDEAWIVAGWSLAVHIPAFFENAAQRWPWVRQGLLQLREGARRNPASWRIPYNEGWIVLLHVRPDPGLSARLVRDPVLDPEHLPPEAYALRRFERAAQVPGHALAVDWARLAVLVHEARASPASRRAPLLRRIRSVLAHVRRDHRAPPAKLLASWERELQALSAPADGSGGRF